VEVATPPAIEFEHYLYMADLPKKLSHKYGANRKEIARRFRKRDHNFSQSRDIREDRGERQTKTANSGTPLPRASQAQPCIHNKRCIPDKPGVVANGLGGEPTSRKRKL
jgi:hypothetical protein